MTDKDNQDTPISVNRRSFLQATGGIGVAGFAGVNGIVSAKEHSDYNSVIELEAVHTRNNPGRGPPDHAGGSGGGPPDHAGNGKGAFAWVGIAPEEIADEENPTLSLVAGEEYTLEWTSTTNAPHAFIVVNEDGDEILASDEATGKGETVTVEFTATEEMAAYHCGYHSTQMQGSIVIDDGSYADNPALSPEEALDTFELPDGWKIEQVASEPLINSPVDIKWDAEGRMWVVEMPDYMDLVPGDGRGGDEPGNYGDWGDADMSLEEMTGWGDELSDEEPNGAVKVLEDTDGDGIMDKATTFADTLTLSRAFSLVDADDALMVAHAGSAVDEPDLFLATDENGDLEADSKEPLIDSWVNEDNPEHTSNALDYNLNNWIYNSNSTDRFQYRNGDIVEANTHSRGQWQICQDNYGRLYSTHNSNWLFADFVPGHGDYLLRDPDNETSNGVAVDVDPDGTVYPVREVWGTNRSYPGGWESHRDDGRIETITAISGPGVYRGDVFSEELVNDVFVCEPKAQAIAHFATEEEEDDLGLDVEHVVYDNDEWGDQEFLASSDEVFKPVNVKMGPDGALYVVDMYNGIFQHNRFLTDYLAEYYLENDLHKVPPAGRIYRIYPEDAELDDPPALDELAPEKLAEQLEHGNGWVRLTAQRSIVQGNETDAVSTLQRIAQESDSPLGRMHALWALHGLGEIDASSVFAVMDDTEDSHVLANAMQTGEALLETDDAKAYVDRLVDFADADHLRLVVQAAYSLGEVTDDDPSLQETARATLERLLVDYEGNTYVEDAVHSSPEMDIEPQTGPYTVEDTEGVHTDVFHIDDGQVGRYMYEYDPGNQGDTFKPYLHVWDSEIDEPLTADPSQEVIYDHHRGIFIGWNDIEVDGQGIDNWHTDPIIHQEYDPSLEEFDEEQALTAINHWLTEPDGDVFVTETRRMEFQEPQTEDGISIVDCTFTLEFETDVELYGDPEHGGIQYRAHGDVDDNRSAEYYFSDHWDWGENPGEGSVDEAFGYDWVAMECEMHDDDYFVAIMNHPDNPMANESTVSAYRDYGRFGFYWEGSFEEGDEITVDYRFVVERGSAPEGEADEINEWFADYAGEDVQFEFNGQTNAWVGIAPGEIEGEENPTLTLQEGEMYEIGWTEGDGAGHNIAIRNDEGDIVDDLRTEITSDPGDDQWLEFEATAEMAEYVCEPHVSAMVGEIDVQ